MGEKGAEILLCETSVAGGALTTASMERRLGTSSKRALGSGLLHHSLSELCTSLTQVHLYNMQLLHVPFSPRNYCTCAYKLPVPLGFSPGHAEKGRSSLFAAYPDLAALSRSWFCNTNWFSVCAVNKKTILPLERAPVISQTLNVVAKTLTLSPWNKGDHSENTSPVWFGHLLLRPSPGKLNSSLSFFFLRKKTCTVCREGFH